MKFVRWALIAMLAVGTVNAADTVSDQFASARDLYARADYGEALAVLNRLRETGTTAETLSIMQYRALCLLALGQTAEAEHAVEAMVAAVPSYRAAEPDISPRLQSIVTRVRRRTLPDIVQQKYVAAITAYERKDYEPAIALFREVLRLLDDPDIAPAAAQRPLSDLRLLATGFVALRMGAIPSSAPISATPLAPAASLRGSPFAVAPVARPRPTGVYTASSGDIVPPVTVRQTLPAYVSSRAHPIKGLIEVTIDENGAVTEAKMRMPTHTSYDAIALAAARSWRYKAALVGTVPVKYLKLVYINIAASQ
jgi:tetratricopeptide (TPR) repeat protein